MKALVAIERHIIQAACHILSNNEPYRELGGDYHIKRRPGPAIRKAVDQLRAAGYQVTFQRDPANPDAPPTPSPSPPEPAQPPRAAESTFGSGSEQEVVCE
jgi:hypothetical protein